MTLKVTSVGSSESGPRNWVQSTVQIVDIQRRRDTGAYVVMITQSWAMPEAAIPYWRSLHAASRLQSPAEGKHRQSMNRRLALEASLDQYMRYNFYDLYHVTTESRMFRNMYLPIQHYYQLTHQIVGNPQFLPIQYEIRFKLNSYFYICYRPKGSLH